MKTSIVFVIGLLVCGAFSAEADAKSSCREYFNTCAARCKTRAPTDKNCVSDHCTPKLGACRRSGCWQEGNMYGGGRQCDLKK